jgi:hypothetical protein
VFIEELFDEHGDEVYSEEVEETEFFINPALFDPNPFFTKHGEGFEWGGFNPNPKLFI